MSLAAPLLCAISGAELNQREVDVLHALASYQHTHGYAPAIRELGLMVGLQSPSTVSWYLDMLERKGYIRRVRRRPRSVAIICAPGDLG